MHPPRLTLTLLLLSVSSLQAAPTTPCHVLAKLPHATTSYTEGFFFRDGRFYEGTGLNGHSAVLITDPATGKILQRRDLPSDYFGEGIIDWGNNLYEWTWQSRLGFILDRISLRPVGQFHYDGEGWGMTRTDREIITSDGTAILRFRNPDTFDVTRQLVVRDGATPIRNLNELEYIPGRNQPEIYANIWHSDRIARINPATGQVIAWLDCTGILPENQKIDAESVLNGIAFDPQHNRLYVTGKQWPTIFQIQLPISRQPNFSPKSCRFPVTIIAIPHGKSMKSAPCLSTLILASSLFFPLIGCQVEPEMQRCVDLQDHVVADSFCATPARIVHIRGSLYPEPLYRFYYGGGGSFDLGSKAWGGSERPLAGHAYRAANSARQISNQILDATPQPYVSPHP